MLAVYRPPGGAGQNEISESFAQGMPVAVKATSSADIRSPASDGLISRDPRLKEVRCSHKPRDGQRKLSLSMAAQAASQKKEKHR